MLFGTTMWKTFQIQYKYPCLCGRLCMHTFAYSSVIHLVSGFGNDMPKTTGDTGAGGVHQQVGDFYSCEESWAIKGLQGSDRHSSQSRETAESTYLQMAWTKKQIWGIK